MKKEIIEIKAPTYYGDPKLWALEQIIYLDEQKGYDVLSVEPVANEKNELISIKVEVKRRK